MRRSGALRNALATIAMVGAAALLAGCGVATEGQTGAASVSGSVSRHAPEQRATGASATAWQGIAPSPLSPRDGAVTVWTGSKALFLGGDDGPPCPPTADCVAPQMTTDGAAYDPATNSWTRTADSPEPIQGYSGSQLVGDTVYLWGTEHLLAYTPATDTWRALDGPDIAAEFSFAPLAALGDSLVVVMPYREEGDSTGYLLDSATDTWSALPEDPLGPTTSRMAVGIPGGMVLLAHDLVANPNSATPSVVRAAVLDSSTETWRQLPDSDLLGEGAIGWSGTRVVIAGLGGADGGEVNNWGRMVPNGGTLDPATGQWSTLGDAPEADYRGLSAGERWPVSAIGGPYFATVGYVYNDDAGTWTPLAPPADGPNRPGDAVWAGDRLIVVGGIDDPVPVKGQLLVAPTRATGAWMLTCLRCLP